MQSFESAKKYATTSRLRNKCSTQDVEQFQPCRLYRWLSSCSVSNSIAEDEGNHLQTDRGPEVETWFGVEDGSDPALDNDWSFLPFMALSDGAHM